MPELPEVETVCRGLAPVLTGRTLKQVVQRRADLRIPFPHDFIERLEGQRIEAVSRRAKYVLVHLESGDVLVIHLGMSGRINIVMPVAPKAENGAPGPHDHVTFHTDDGTEITYCDPRRFGLMTIVVGGDFSAHKLFASLGPEPLGNEFGPDLLSAALKDRRSAIKAALLDQRIVAGLGNIYVCEALYRSGISPKRLAHSVGMKRVQRLAETIRDVLQEAIASGGSTLRDYAQVDGELGYFQHSFQVYGREGEVCKTDGCGQTIRRMVQSNRSTFYCPSCQR